jgi:glycosyltransferase involved in cell wall biosynthesis
MDKHAVSVIVPVYNVAKYIERCVESIMGQTHKDIDVILVDDGSSDGSGDICDELAKKYVKIKVIHQKNRGLSGARNVGIRAARGEYLVFVDSDDYVDEEFVAKLYAAVDKRGPSVAVCGYREVRGAREKNVLPSEVGRMTGGEALTNLLTKQDDIDVVAWNKLYHHTLFDEVEFPEGEIHEDNLTTYKLYALAKTVSYVGVALYYYVRRDDSITSEYRLFDRGRYKEQAARESVIWLKKNNVRHVGAAKVALFYAKLTYLDEMVAVSEIDRKMWKKQVDWILNNYAEIKSEGYLSGKMRIYVMILRFGVMPYRVVKTILLRNV